MTAAPSFALAFAATAAAGLGGMLLGTAWSCGREAARRRRRMRASTGAKEGDRRDLPENRLVGYAVEVSRRLALRATAPILGGVRPVRAEAWLDVHAKKAGVAGDVTPEGFAEASLRLAGAFAAAAALAGALFSTELAVLGAAAGAAAGATALARAIKQVERERAEALGRSLSEMLETVALGLRSGLSFDRSFRLYGEHFDVPFARECAAAQRAWTFGLSTREEALRDLAASYDSTLLARVVESVVRSLRFGSSLAEGLETAAAEARADHRAHVEEQVAKAPVKMMVPTGTLILPAMLLLVLGPVLLELMEGF